jgi:uncharacterized protein YutE (UPF0331/DUF86 family)
LSAAQTALKPVAGAPGSLGRSSIHDLDEVLILNHHRLAHGFRNVLIHVYAPAAHL